jgi:Methane oxygenase PmoA/Oxidoreductase family, C-terminal alpha/beta domain
VPSGPIRATSGEGPWFATVYQHRFGGAQGWLKTLVAAGTLGRPLVAVCHTTWFRDQAYFDVPWRGRWETEGGGPTMGHGIHQLDMLLDVLGDWAEVRAVARRQARRTRTEDVSLAHVTFASGAVASVVNSVLSPREDKAELFRYVYRPDDPPAESPRPYLHPVRTLAGVLVTGCRPEDHPWHKGISWALPNVGPENFWGGPTYRRGDGYIQLGNNGAMRHDRFETVEADGARARLAERLTWVTAAGRALFAERRRITAAVRPDRSEWSLDFVFAMRNLSGGPVDIGSPTTQGRENAGYGGLFWRGPAAFTGGRVLTPDGAGGDEIMGRPGPWLAFAGPAATLAFRDNPANPGYPCRWFVRRSPYACAGPAPFFAAEVPVPAGGELTYRYEVTVTDGTEGVFFG